MKYLILLFILISCGDSPDNGSGYAGCNINTDSVKSIWQSEVTGVTYDLRSCGHSTSCTMCFSPLCNGTQDFNFYYTPEGAVSLHYPFYSKWVTANWQMCDGKLELYNFSDKSVNEKFKETI